MNPSPVPSQFYTVSPAQPPLPPKPPFPWRTLGVVVAVLSGVVFVVVFGMNLWRNRPAAVALRNAEGQLSEQLSACAAGDEACAARARMQSAVDAGQISFCEGLAPASVATCVSRLARAAGKPEYCRDLHDVEKDRCVDGAVTAEARAKNDVKICEGAATVRGRQGCETSFVPSAPAPSGTMADCARETEEERASCEDWFRSIDADGDGLSRAEEERAGTSDERADSDGDGYADGVEVESGYNPLGQ